MENNAIIGKRILLVEDEETLAVGLEFNLQLIGQKMGSRQLNNSIHKSMT
jgi:hypothetical protein